MSRSSTGDSHGKHEVPQSKSQQRIRLQRPSPEGEQKIFWGQLMHHRQRRRLRQLQQQQQVLKSRDQNPQNSWNWRKSSRRARLSLTNDTKTKARKYAANDGDVPIVPLSNCHFLVYTGDIALGTPPQKFTVAWDTSADDFWVPSKDCDNEMCLPLWRRYDAGASSTAAKAMVADTDFEEAYFDGESLKGTFVQDTLWLGNSSSALENALFVAVTMFNEYNACPGQEGVFGLGRSNTTRFGLPSPLQQLLTASPSILRHHMFSLYLNKAAGDDYPPDPSLSGGTQDNSKDASLYRPTTAHSELVFGGIRHQRYQGCLHWHNVPDLTADYGSEASVYWTLSLQGVKVDDEVFAYGGNIALLDSASTFLIGPPDGIAAYLKMNTNVECFDLNEAGAAFAVPCDNPFGFDAAVTPCDAPVLPMTFVVDNQSYEITTDELLLKVDTEAGPVCFVRVLVDPGIAGWVLGDVFLNRYYSVYDFETNRIGLARSSVDGTDDGTYCQDDWPLDLEYEEGVPVPESVPTVINPAPSPSTVTTVPSPDHDTKTVPPPKIGGATSSTGTGTTTPGATGTTKSGSKQQQQSLTIAISLVLGAILMVFVLSRRLSSRRRQYRRAGRYQGDGLYLSRSVDDDDGSGDMELPGRVVNAEALGAIN